MSDLIDREQAKDAIDKYLVGKNLVTDGTMMARLINGSVIDRLPSAELKIIRCKDCKWWDRYNDVKGYCMAAKSCTYTSHWDIQIRRTYNGDFYCAHAEPKEEYEEGEDG